MPCHLQRLFDILAQSGSIHSQMGTLYKKTSESQGDLRDVQRMPPLTVALGLQNWILDITDKTFKKCGDYRGDSEINFRQRGTLDVSGSGTSHQSMVVDC